jgi:hypothetical protein
MRSLILSHPRSVHVDRHLESLESERSDDESEKLPRVADLTTWERPRAMIRSELSRLRRTATATRFAATW